MESARSSASNNRMVIYGLGGSAQEAMKFSRYGVNAVFHEPLERQAALKLVRATQMLVLHEFRRYIRIPIITEISMVRPTAAALLLPARRSAREGCRSRARRMFARYGGGSFVRLIDSAPDLGAGTVSWRKPDKTFGVRFDAKDERRMRIKEWIEAYLEN